MRKRKIIILRIVIVLLAVAVLGLRKLSGHWWLHDETAASVGIDVLTFLAMCAVWVLAVVQYKLGKSHDADEKTEEKTEDIALP